MLHLHRAERADRLVDALAAILATPPTDPFAPEVIAVPTRGMERWLTQRLSVRLGATPGRTDGVCANVEFPFPGRLIGGSLAAASGVDEEEDPWSPERSVWPLLSIVDGCRDEQWLARLSAHLEPDRRFGRVRLIADLFDQYGVRRPEMVQAWSRGQDLDGAGDALPEESRWQPELWRRLRAAVGTPSSAERLEPACSLLRKEPSIVDLPERVSLFGLTRLPASYVQALTALAVGRDVHLFLLHPSPALWSAVSSVAGSRVILRAGDRSGDLADNRLLGSWGVDSRELQLVLASAGEHTDTHHALAEPVADTLLRRIQSDLRANRPPPGIPAAGTVDQRLLLAPEDNSIAIHSCHGPARQVEVLREAIMHLLEADPTLEPRDVIVMCPDIETFAPLIQATFGSIDVQDLDGAAEEPSRADLRVRLADRSLRQTNPVLGVVAQLIDLAELRLTASQMLDLADSEPVRRRFRFDDDDISRIQTWVAASGIRWGLDKQHRVDYRLEQVDAGTWRAGLRRLLLGVAMNESERRLFESVLPMEDVESGEIELAGRFAEFVERVGVALDSFTARQAVNGWVAAISDAADALTLVGERDAWQRYELDRMLAAMASESGEAVTTTISLPEVRALLSHRLQGRPTRANFRTGHLTVCTLVPMRSVPHRVVCLLGLDDGAFPRKTPRDGDDLLLDTPHVGDRDPRTEDRQMLLDALLAAEEQLIVMFSGADERTNAPRPPAVPVGELLDTVDRTARGEVGRARDLIVVCHPLQSFDPRNFIAGALAGDGPWGFDSVALEGAEALGGERVPRAPLLVDPLPASPVARLSLDDLVAFAERPVRAFLRQRLGVSTSDFDDDIEDGLPVELDGLEKWTIGQRVLDGVLAGIDGKACIDAEMARGELPPGELRKPVIKGISDIVNMLVVASRPLSAVEPRSVAINLVLGDGLRLSGSVSGVRGPALLSVRYSRLNPRHRLAAWVRLVALTVAYPSEPFEAVTIGRAAYGTYADVMVARVPPLGAERARASLDRLLDLYSRGMREPLPIPSLTSAAYAAAAFRGDDPEAAAKDLWEGGFRRDVKIDGEDVDADHQRAFGGVRLLAEVIGVPPRGDESGSGWELGEPSRFGRYARRLWDELLAVEEVSER